MAPSLDPKHPYQALQNTALWLEIDDAIAQLIGNQDIVENTRHETIVGYLCKRLLDAGLVRG